MNPADNLEAARPGYYADLEAFRVWLLQQNAQDARIRALTVDVVATCIAFLAAETEAELAPDALQSAAQALLTLPLPELAPNKKAHLGGGELADSGVDDVTCRLGLARQGLPQ